MVSVFLSISNTIQFIEGLFKILNGVPKIVYVGKDIVLSGNFLAKNFFKIRRTKSDNIK